MNREANNPNRSLYDNNKEVYRLLRYGVNVKVEASVVTDNIKLINWTQPDKNDFAIAEEVMLHGNQERRPGPLHQRHRGRRNRGSRKSIYSAAIFNAFLSRQETARSVDMISPNVK